MRKLLYFKTIYDMILPMKTAQNISTDHLQVEISSLNEVIAMRNEKIADLEEQLAWFKRQVFGKKSEKYVSNLNSQQLMLEGFENKEESSKVKEKDVPAHKRRTPIRDGQDKIKLPSDLPVVTIVLDLPEDQKVCQTTGEALVKIGEEVSHKLAHTPGSYYIKEIIRPKYAHPTREEMGILTAELPEAILPRCRADNSFLADILVKKFADHLPLYRISEILAREGIQISRKLMSQWVVRCGIALKPLYDEMKKLILASENIYVDESPVKVQMIGKIKQGYMWVIVGGNEANPSYRIYDFREDRCHKNIFEILTNYKGGLHSDKYGAYETLAKRKEIIWYPCWAHIRRKFFEAESGDPELRKWVLRKIKYLFMFEKVAWSRSPEERLKIRQEKEVPIIDELIEKIKDRLVKGNVLPKSKFRGALGYFCGLIPNMKNYTKSAFARLENNVAERAIRPLALGRKNWLFFGSIEGGQSAAVILSLVQTCRGLGINPREYLEDIFGRLMSHNAQKLHELLPDQWLLNRQKDKAHTSI